MIEASPVKDIHFKAPPLPPIQPYSLEELKRFLAVCELNKTGARFTGLRNKAMLLVFIDSGLRLSEQIHLKLGGLDLEQRWVRVIGKGNKIGKKNKCVLSTHLATSCSPATVQSLAIF